MSRRLHLAKALVSLAKTGTPIRHARGVVVSSSIGQSQVTLDGGATQIPAFNYGHTNSLPTGAVVDVLLAGKKGYVLGSYDGAVSVGALLGHAFGPGSTTSFTTLSTAASVVAPVTLGYKYLISGRIIGSQVTNAGGIAHADLSTDDGVVTNVRFWNDSSVAVSASAGGGGSTIYTPAATRTTTFTLSVFSSVASWSVAANAAELIVIRVA